MKISSKVRNYAFVIALSVITISGCASPQKLEKNNADKPATEQISNNSNEKDEMVEEKKEVEEEKDEPEKNNEVEEQNSESADKDQKDQEQNPEINYQEVKPYEAGHIMIVMYHGIIDNPPYHRTAEEFKKDLKYMYDHGYRPVSMRDYVDNNISIEPGYTPIVLTFDDGLPSTFSLMEEEGVLKPVPGTAVAIMEEFAKEHPDFGNHAAFYINGNNNPFEGAGTLQQRLKYLVDHGYDVSNHTYSHEHLSELGAEKIQEQIGKVDQMIKEALPDYTVDTFSYPFGERPREELRHLIEKGTYEGKEYHYVIGLREGPSGPFVAPNHVRFSPFNLPRVRGSEGAEGDLWWYFDYYEQHPTYRYISDGNPNRIAVPEKYQENINQESLGEKELYIYQLEQ